MYRLQHEFDFEPSYIFAPDQSDEDEPVITVAPGNYPLARRILLLLNEAAESDGEVAATGVSA